MQHTAVSGQPSANPVVTGALIFVNTDRRPYHALAQCQ